MFDKKCYDLAVDFLEEVTPTPPDSSFDKLAQCIQDTIEDFLNDADNFPPPEPTDTRSVTQKERSDYAASQRYPASPTPREQGD